MRRMPPKKEKKKKKTVTAEPPSTDQDSSGPSDKELILEKHLEKITEDLDKCKMRVTELQRENKCLEEEATKTRIESHEYMNYMGKKTSRRQTVIVTLSDHNKELIKTIQEEKQLMEERYDQKKKEMQTILLGKKHALEKTKNQMNELQECKDLQEEQLKRIKELEKEVIETRNHHATSIQALKEDFIKDKEQFRLEAENKIHTLHREANKEAVRCLSHHTENIQNENRILRKELLELIQKNHALLTHQQQLEEQHKRLLQEQQYAEDLQRLRGKRLQKILKYQNCCSTHTDLERAEDCRVSSKLSSVRNSQD